MASNNNEERWYFTKEQLDNSPSRQCGIEAYKELSYRQQAANFIQDLGQRLKVSQLCINTAIVYMHRFYVFHSFTHFPWHLIASAALFLAAKVEEQPRKLEYVIRVANLCKNPRDTTFDTTSERYLAQSQDLVFNENILLQTLGFDVAIDHPNTHVVKCCHLVKASKDLAQTSYFMASNSLHLTTMCLQYKPTVVACFCIHLACKWSNWEIPLSNEKKEWFYYVDSSVTSELLQQLTEEFLVIFERSPSRLKEKIKMIGDGHQAVHHHPSPPFDDDKRSLFMPPEQKEPHSHRSHHLDSKSSKVDDMMYKRSLKLPHEASSSSQRDRDKEREYRERKERERLAGKYPSSMTMTSKHPLSMSMSGSKHMHPPHGHHSSHLSSSDAKMKAHSRAVHPSLSSHHSISRMESKREALLKELGEIANEAVNRENNLQLKSEKDFQKQYLRDSANSQRHDVKPIVTNDGNCDITLNDSRVNYNSDKKAEVSRTSVKVPGTSKHDFIRKRDEHNSHIKLETDTKKHLSSDYNDKNNSLLDGSNKLKSPLVANHPSKISSNQVIKTENTSLSNNSYNSLPSLANSFEIKTENDNEDHQLPVKRPSLFSPEASPPKTKSSPPFLCESLMNTHNKQHHIQDPSNKPSNGSKRNRNSNSTSTEPELRPVMKKIDQVEGFENLMRDSSIGLKLQVPDIITPISESSEVVDVKPSIAKDMKPPDLILPFPKAPTTTTSSSHSLVNGIETNPTLISNLLKETPTIPHLQTVPILSSTVKPSQPLPLEVESTSVVTEPQKEKEREHHKERKKNKKEKHKHKDKTKDEKEKKKKHKDKDREKHKHKQISEEVVVTQPIKITIPKDKIQPPESLPPTGSGLKIKIPKERIKTESLENPVQNSPGELKIRIPKGILLVNDSGKKRERDKNSSAMIGVAPPSKISRSNHHHGQVRQNDKNSYNSNKETQPIENYPLKLAEPKFNHKEASM